MADARSFAASRLTLALLLLAPALAAAQTPTTGPVVHEHAALLYVNPLKSADGKTIENDAMWQRAILSEVVLARSEIVFFDTLEDNAVQKTQWYTRAPAAALAALRRDTRVEPVPGTALIAIWVEGAGKDGPRLANAIARARLKSATDAAEMKKKDRMAALKAVRERVATDLDTDGAMIQGMLLSGAATKPERQGELQDRRERIRRLSDQHAALTEKLDNLNMAEPDVRLSLVGEYAN